MNESELVLPEAEQLVFREALKRAGVRLLRLRVAVCVDNGTIPNVHAELRFSPVHDHSYCLVAAYSVSDTLYGTSGMLALGDYRKASLGVYPTAACMPVLGDDKINEVSDILWATICPLIRDAHQREIAEQRSKK